MLKGESTKFTVKIEYNSNYVGDAAGTSGMADLTLKFIQNSGGTIVPTEDYLVTYDYTTNGGTSTNAENAYLSEGEAVNLNYTAAKENAEFLGWNTNSQANEGLIGLSMPANNITLYAIFKDIDTTPPVITNISTTSTINSITVVTTATEEDSEIDTYEYSIDNGTNWIKVSGDNSYTFTNLKSNTEYSIMVRVRNTGNTYAEQTITVSTKKLNAPTFVETETDNGKTVTIIYPEGEGLTYEYQKDGGSWTTASKIQEVEFTASGTLVARVSDGTNSESATLVVSIPIYMDFKGQKLEIVSSGDGLYADSYEENVYTYRGANPNNYVTFNGEQWRIISVNTSDNTIKIMRNGVLTDKRFDSPSGRYSSGGYCNNSSFGCKVWGSSSTTYDTNLNPITTLGREYNRTKYTLPTAEAELNTYLNGEYYNGLNATAKSMIKEDAVYKVGVLYYNNKNITTDMNQLNAAKWKGKVALIDPSEYLRASTNSNCTNITAYYNNSSCYNNSSSHNWMYLNDIWWTLSPYSYSNSHGVWYVSSGSSLSSNRAYYSYGVRPVVTLSGEVKITSGNGSSSQPYQLT